MKVYLMKGNVSFLEIHDEELAIKLADKYLKKQIYIMD